MGMTAKSLGAVIAGCLVILVSPVTGWGAYDPPHTGDNAVDCGNCHYTNGAGAPPSWMSPGGDDNTVNNLRCMQCHTLYKTHSATATGSSLWQDRGGWQAECVDCHNPHYQMQSKRWGAESYLTTGTVSSVGAWQPLTNETVITLSAPLGAEYQGYYLVPNTAYRNFLYKIKTLTNGQSQVTVKGKVGAGAVFPKAGPGTSFAIVYARNIKDAIQYSNPGAATVGSLQVKMFRQGGTRGPGDSAHADESVCYVCHTMVSPAAAPGVAEHQEPSAACTACHTHDEGFRPACSACHAFPPLDASGLVSSPLPTGSATAGAHGRHATPSGMNYGCDICHNQGMPTTPISGNNRIQIGFSLFGTVGGTYDGQTLINGYTYEGKNGTTVTAGGTKTCSNIYCHGNYSGSGKNASPAWGVAAGGACGTCHGASNSLTPSSGKHAAHADLAYYGFACTLCHKDIVGGSSPANYSIADKGRHVNGFVDYKFDPADPRTAGGAYSIASGTAAPSDGVTPRSFGACNNIYCHSNVQPEGGVGSPSRYANPAWAVSASVACGSCHDGGHGALLGSGSHTAHLAYDFTTSNIFKCIICHSWDQSLSLTCSSCHNFHVTTEYTKHANYKVEVLFDPAFNRDASYGKSPSFTPGTGYSDCANTYCHGNGTSVATGTIEANISAAWGITGPLACNTCHGNPPSYPNTAPKANSHQSPSHAGFPCWTCHATTTAADNIISSRTTHVNKAYDVDPGPGIAFSYSYAPTGGVCSSVSCHGNGAAKTWGGL